MGRIVSIIQFTGRAGSAVGSKGRDGKIVIRQYQPSVANPRTAAQMAQRAKMKLAAQVAGMLGVVGRTSLMANGNRKTDRGQLIKQLLKNIRVNQDGSKASLGYDLNLIDNPCYNRSLNLAVSSSENAFVATYSGAEDGEVIAKCILVHDITNGTWRHTNIMDTANTISIGKSKNEEGSAIEVFAYGIVLMPKTTEGYNNIGQTGADNRGYVVDLNKVSSTNYDFSPCVSAALAVASNGTAEASNGSSASGGSSNTGGSSNSGGNSETPSNGGSETPSGGSDTPPEGGGAVNGEN
ncbi:MAG: hypothetical protein II817_10150 [Bacteroidales bacterium]|nr:hypothetical protein [Bacteroidales bacterium]